MPRPFRSLIALTLGLLSLAVAPPGALAADDPAYVGGLQWGLDRIGAGAARAIGTGRGTTIAVIDSGVDLEHPEFAGRVRSDISCVGANGDPGACRGSGQDDNGHGTHVAGVALAGVDGKGIAGVAPDALLLAVRVLTNQCTSTKCTAIGTATDVAAGIRWAVDHGADVINLSLGGGAMEALGSCALCEAIEYAWRHDVIPVIAAGNDSDVPPDFGDEPAVIVTATTRDDERASYADPGSAVLRDARWPVAAPGGEAEADARDCGTGGSPRGILSTYWVDQHSGQYACQSGTSMAAPHVSGALAVLRGLGLDPGAAIAQLLSSAEDLGPPGRDSSFGFGRIDLARAVGSVQPTETTAATSMMPRPVPTPAGPDGDLALATPPPSAVPSISTPDNASAALFTSAAPSPSVADVPAWLIVTAVAAAIGSGAATAVAAKHRARSSM